MFCSIHDFISKTLSLKSMTLLYKIQRALITSSRKLMLRVRVPDIQTRKGT